MSGASHVSIDEFLQAVLARAADEAVSTLAAALADEPDGVHQQRVRVRRLRSILAGYRDVIDARAADRVRVAYAEWGHELGAVRDIEVRADVAEDLLARAGIDDPDIARRLVGSERAAYARAHARLVALAGEPRGLARERMLRTLVEAPGIVDPHADAADVVAAVLRRQARRVRKAARRIDGTDDAFHAVRKAARRLRYVAEADAASVLPDAEVEALARAGERLHDSLGGHRDAVLFAQQVARQGVLAARAGESTEAYARVEELARADADEHLADLPSALKSMRRAASGLSAK